jgi:Xaa-Pro dipeptidase
MRRLESLLIDHGGDELSFETIVATGPHSSIPHHQPTDRPIEAGDFLKLDFGAAVNGYHADMTRTLVVGARPQDWQRETYDLVARAQAAGRAALGPGVELAAVDSAARQIIEDAGQGERFPHGLGHGVGLQIHEDPFFAATSTGTLEVGIPVTVEPGVYHPGRGGVRIEDTLVVTREVPELLTTSTKELLVVGT